MNFALPIAPSAATRIHVLPGKRSIPFLLWSMAAKFPWPRPTFLSSAAGPGRRNVQSLLDRFRQLHLPCCGLLYYPIAAPAICPASSNRSCNFFIYMDQCHYRADLFCIFQTESNTVCGGGFVDHFFNLSVVIFKRYHLCTSYSSLRSMTFFFIRRTCRLPFRWLHCVWCRLWLHHHLAHIGPTYFQPILRFFVRPIYLWQHFTPAQISDLFAFVE